MNLLKGLACGVAFSLLAVSTHFVLSRLTGADSSVTIGLVFLSIACMLLVSVGATVAWGPVGGAGFAVAASGLGYLLYEWPIGPSSDAGGAAASDGFDGLEPAVTIAVLLGALAANHFAAGLAANNRDYVSSE